MPQSMVMPFRSLTANRKGEKCFFFMGSGCFALTDEFSVELYQIQNQRQGRQEQNKQGADIPVLIKFYTPEYGQAQKNQELCSQGNIRLPSRWLVGFLSFFVSRFRHFVKASIRVLSAFAGRFYTKKYRKKSALIRKPMCLQVLGSFH